MSALTALVVEDDAELGEIFSDILESRGVAVNYVADGQLALNWLSEFTPDIMMLDLHLPHVSGVEILRHVRSDLQNKHTKVIVVTADALLTGVIKEQADFTLIKPIDLDQLNSLISQLSQ
jgi:two-component system, OmpR family, sensor histidine kinase TorS